MIKFKIFALIFIAIGLISIGTRAYAFDLFGTACKGSTASSPACQQAANQGGDTNNRLTGTQSVINATANIIAALAGVAAVIMVIVSGISFITSRGNTESLAAARRRMIAAIAGVAIVALAWTITRFISDNLIK